MKSHVLFKGTDIYFINFPPQLTQWARIQRARMNNADFKTALLQRMSSSHTVNTNKLPKVLKARTPVPPRPRIPPRRRQSLPCALPAGTGKPRKEPEDGDRPHRPGEKTRFSGLSHPHGPDRPQPDGLSLFVIVAAGARGAEQGRRRPQPLPRPLAI